MDLTQLIERLTSLHLFDKQINALDMQFAKFLQSLYENESHMAVAGFLVSRELNKGHVCLDFSMAHDALNGQELKSLLSQLQACEYLQDATTSPLVLNGQKLYLQKYFQYEVSVAQSIEQRLNAMPWTLAQCEPHVKTLFSMALNESAPEGHEPDWQAVAVCLSAVSGFSVISGGPGTGKTTTVIRLLALLVQLYQGQYQRLPIIKLAAPTGKAANRLTESISGAKSKLNISDDIKQHIPQQALTLHRLLARNAQGGFKYNEFNPLHLDVLIIDEASMVDLPMMAKILKALPAHAQVILLGDKDQLASVEAGSVLADICDNEHHHGYGSGLISQLESMLSVKFDGHHVEPVGASIRNHICHLRKSYRFNEHSGIGQLAKAANQGNYQAWLQVLNSELDDLQYSELKQEHYDGFIIQAAKAYAEYFKILENGKVNGEGGLDDEAAIKVHQAFNDFQILCALKDGPLGVNGLNEAVQSRLKSLNMIKQSDTWYAGRPIIILENDYGLNLYNGDVGIILPQYNEGDGLEEQGNVKLKACFINSEGHVRWLQPSRLPKHETVYAMTIHKSQGSEFKDVALILPDYSAPILTKELLYTGITRAKSTLSLLAKSSMVERALKQKVMRASGLGERLWTIDESIQAEVIQADKMAVEKNTAKQHHVNTKTNIQSEDDQFLLF